MKDDQPELFAPPLQKRPRRENTRLHACAVFLRLKGHQVYRISGAESKIDGTIVTNAQLKHQARIEGME